MPHPRPCAALVFSVYLLSAGFAFADDVVAPSDPAAEIVAQEKLRATVEQAFQLSRAPADDADKALENFVSAADMLESTGPDVVPFVADELDQALAGTFLFSAYTLGRLGTPEAKTALRRAIERADEQRGQFAKNRKAWAGYALGLAGDVDAVRLLNQGRHVVGHFPMYGEMSVIEVAAIYTAPECVPILLDQVDALSKDETKAVQRAFVMRALGRVADPAAVPKLLQVLRTDPLEPTRREALRALAHIDAPEVPAALTAALDDEGPRVRKSAALALDHLQFPSTVDAIVAHLESEENSIVRGNLYHALVELRGVEALPTLRRYWPRPDPIDRRTLIVALDYLRTPQALDVYKAALGDTDSRVYVQALFGLAELGTPEAVKVLLNGVHEARWPLAQTSIERLVDLREASAAPAIAERLLNVELSGVVTDPSMKPRIHLMCEALVTLHHVAAAEGLRAAAERQTDASLALELRDVVARLEAVRKNQDELVPWIEASRSTERSARRQAYRELGRLGSKAAAEALVGQFGRVAPDEGVEILDVLGRVDAPASRELVARVLAGPEFDVVERLPLRRMAAWSARRLGGPDMIEALRSSFERRDGRDAEVGVYLALAAGKDAIPTLVGHRLRFMRYMSALRGRELDRLDALVRDLEAGRSISRYDVAPPLMRY